MRFLIAMAALLITLAAAQAQTVISGNGNGNSNGAGQGQSTDPWRSLPGVESVRHEAATICLNVREPHLTIPALLASLNQQGRKLVHLSTRQASLEDVFVKLTGRHLRED